MLILGQLLAAALGAYLAGRMTEAYLRRFRAVWWQGWLIGVPAVFLGFMLPIAVTGSNRWISKLSLGFCAWAVRLAYDRVRKSQAVGNVEMNG